MINSTLDNPRPLAAQATIRTMAGIIKPTTDQTGRPRQLNRTRPNHKSLYEGRPSLRIFPSTHLPIHPSHRWRRAGLYWKATTDCQREADYRSIICVAKPKHSELLLRKEPHSLIVLVSSQLLLHKSVWKKTGRPSMNLLENAPLPPLLFLHPSALSAADTSIIIIICCAFLTRISSSKAHTLPARRPHHHRLQIRQTRRLSLHTFLLVL